jgi:hypothetical protein
LGLSAAAILQFFSIKILASEPKYGWGWVVGAAIPVILISWHFGFFTISVFMCSFLAFQSYRQVPIERAKLAKRVTNNDL